MGDVPERRRGRGRVARPRRRRPARLAARRRRLVRGADAGAARAARRARSSARTTWPRESRPSSTRPARRRRRRRASPGSIAGPCSSTSRRPTGASSTRRRSRSRSCRPRCRRGGGTRARVAVRAGRRRAAATRGRMSRPPTRSSRSAGRGCSACWSRGEPVTQHPRRARRRRRARGPRRRRQRRRRRRDDARGPRWACCAPGATMLLTDGAQGGLAIDVARTRAGRLTGGTGRVPTERFVDPVGAGDTFLAGVFAARIDPTLLGSGRGPDDDLLAGRRGRARSSSRARAWSASRRATPSCGACRTVTLGPLGRHRPSFAVAALAVSRAPRRRRSASSRGCGAAHRAQPFQQSPGRPGRRQGARPDRASRCSRSFATSIQAMTPRPPPAGRGGLPGLRRVGPPARAAGAPARDRRPGARRSSGRRRPTPRCRPSPTLPVRARAARRGRSRARRASPSAAPARRTSAGPSASTTLHAPPPRAPARSRARPACARTGRGPAARRRGRRRGRPGRPRGASRGRRRGRGRRGRRVARCGAPPGPRSPLDVGEQQRRGSARPSRCG